MTTLALRVAERARETPDLVAMREKVLGIWEQTSWAEYWANSMLVGHALLSLGVGVGDRVAIHSENRREWLFSDIGTVAIRAASVGIYPTSPAAEVLHLIGDSGSKILIAEDQEQVDKALEIIDQLPNLQRIVYIDPRGIEGAYDHPLLIKWEDFLALGSEHARQHRGAVEALAAAADPSDLATLVYTSGTTGPPKGAMLTVGNIEYVCSVADSRDGLVNPPPSPRDQMVSYLPLSHVAERAFTTWFNAATADQINFAESIDTVQTALREVQPTIVFGVPRIWEKIMAGVEIRMNGASWLKRANYRFWMGVSGRIGRTLVENNGRHTGSTRILYALGWVFLYRALRERLGLLKTRHAISGAAPIAPQVLEFFMGIGVPMHEAYGMTENSAIATANHPGRIALGTVGQPVHDTEITLDPETSEILVRNRGVFAGYWNRPDATADTLLPDGWLRTGDVGEWAAENHLKITDRLKDIIITSGGKNISPSEIENSLKASPYIKEAVVIGDGRRYLTALIGIELDTVGNWARRQRLSYTTYRDLTQRDEVRALVAGVIKETNTAFASVETIKDFHLLGRELDQDLGELTATQKVKRPVVSQRFAEQIDAMYDTSTRNREGASL